MHLHLFHNKLKYLSIKYQLVRVTLIKELFLNAYKTIKIMLQTVISTTTRYSHVKLEINK